MLSLGSTGFTTVEEMGNTLNEGGNPQLCSGIAFKTFEKVDEETGDREEASRAADAAFEACMDLTS